MKEKKVKTFVRQKAWLFCNKCRNRTKHTCKMEHYPTESRLRFEPDFAEADGTKYFGIAQFYRFWVCDGCGDGLLEDCRDGCKVVGSDGDYYHCEPQEVSWHPDRSERSVPVRSYANLPRSVASIYYETVFSHHRCLYLLCGMGLRSLIEAICVDQKIDGKNLAGKIEGLRRILPAKTAEKFHALRSIGNQAAHELKESQPDELHLGIEICEDVLNFLYELDHRASKLMRLHQAKKKLS